MLVLAHGRNIFVGRLRVEGGGLRVGIKRTNIPNRFLGEAVAMGGVHGRGDFDPVGFRIDGVEDGDAELQLGFGVPVYGHDSGCVRWW